MDAQHQAPVVFDTVERAVEHIHDGQTIAIGGIWFVRLPIALVEALVRKGANNLTVIAQGSGLALEQLISANLVKKVIFSFASLDIFGLPPFFRKAVESGSIEWEEWTALRMNQALEAGRQNLPFLTMQPPWGSEFMEETDGFKIAACPFTGRTVGMVRAIQPDVALIHAQQADDKGNILIRGSRGIDRLLIGASKQAFVSVEEVVPEGRFTPDARGIIIPHYLINRVCAAPGGAYPASCMPYYITDYWHLSEALPEAKQSGTYERLRKPRGGRLQERVSELRAFAQVDAAAVEAKIKAGESAPAADEPRTVDEPHTVGEPSAADEPHTVDEPSAADEPYTVDELMACLLAAEVRDHTISTVGSNTPLSMVAYLLAKKTHAPDVVLIPFCGLNDISAYPITLSLAEVFAFQQSTSHWAIEDLWQWLYQKKLVNIEFGSTAQLDRQGRINNSIIGGKDRIKVRLPGQAGLADVMNLHHHAFYYITRQDPKRMVDCVDYSSGARRLLPEKDRERAGLPGGLFKVLTNLGVFELDRSKGTLVLTHIHPGVSVEEVQEQTGFPLVVGSSLQTTKAPTKRQIHLIRQVIDPFGFRKLEFAAGPERQALIHDMLSRERQMIMEGEFLK